MRKQQYLLKKLLPLVIIFISTLIILLLDGDACLFKRTTGLPCPGCGMTRAFLALARLDVKSAFYYHPLFVLPIIIVMIIMFKEKRIIKQMYGSNTFWLIILFLVVSVWVIRMICLFPNNPPMDVYKDAILLRLIRLFMHWFNILNFYITQML